MFVHPKACRLTPWGGACRDSGVAGLAGFDGSAGLGPDLHLAGQVGLQPALRQETFWKKQKIDLSNLHKHCTSEFMLLALPALSRAL